MRTFDRSRDTRDEEWRPGVRTRMMVSQQMGSSQFTIFEQWCDPGHGAPTHTHVVEETLEVFDGRAEFALADERVVLTAGQGIIVPAGIPHGFVNVGSNVLHTRATLASSIFEARYLDPPREQRRWGPHDD